MQDKIGHLEEIILLIVMKMHEQEPYGVMVAEEYAKVKKKTITIPAVHTVLRRLEEKGLLKSRKGNATQKRGGRSKTIYQITSEGYKVLERIKEERSKLWQEAPKIKWA